jgi:hypothetical protein
MTKQEFLVMDEKSRYDYMISIGWIADENGQVYSHTGRPVGSKASRYTLLAITFGRKKEHITLRAHRFIWYFFHRTIADTVDHINQDRFDNRITNLRSVTQQQNTFNTKTKGYCYDKKRNKWKAQIMLNRKNIFLGRYDTKQEAYLTYLEAKKRFHII